MYKKILVTGSTGFVGKNLIPYLSYRFPDANVLGLLHTEDSHDLRSYSGTCNLFHNIQPDCVIHLAAKCGGIGANREQPAVFMNDNLLMGLNIINAAWEYNVKKLVMLGSICAYPKHSEIPFQEKNIWNGYPEETNAPYGIAKKTLTELLIAFHKQYGFNSVNLYPTNMYGPHDNFNLNTSHVIPAIILKVYNAMQNGDSSIELWGTGTPTRDFLYVEDCCRAISLALQHNPGPKPINIGTKQEISIEELAATICYKMKFDGVVRWDQTQPDGQPRRCVDSTRATLLLSYKPLIDIDHGLNKTIDWFINNINEV